MKKVNQKRQPPKRRPVSGNAKAPVNKKPRQNDRLPGMDKTEHRPQPADESKHVNIISGRNNVIEALKSDCSINRVYIADNIMHAFDAQIVELCELRGVPYQRLTRAKLAQLAGDDNRGIACELAAANYLEVEDIIALAKGKDQPPLLVILDDIEDPHNLGAIIRTALCVGAHGVIIPKRRAAQLNDTAARTSAGAFAYMPVARVANLAQTIEQLKAAGLWIAGADMHGKTCWDCDFSGPLAVVFGSEGKGISRLIKEKCDFLTSIPVRGAVTSLNVSAAAAVILYEVAHARCE